MLISSSFMMRPITNGSLNHTLNMKHAKMMVLRNVRWPITYRIVAQSCRSCRLQLNMRKARWKQKYQEAV